MVSKTIGHGKAADPLALVRRLRREGVSRREAERLALADCSPTTDLAEAARAAVATAYSTEADDAEADDALAAVLDALTRNPAAARALADLLRLSQGGRP